MRPPDAGTGRRRSRAIPAAAAAAVAVAVAVILGVVATSIAARHSTPKPRTALKSSPPAAASEPPAPNGTFTTPAGNPATIASLRGKPTMVWLVAAGCASCAASIPAVASNLGRITGDGVQILTLGLYGAFPPGRNGVTQLLSFGRAAGGNMSAAGWRWGMASEALSMAYDPSGTPDVYVLVGPGGHIRYRNSVPVSTMPQLLGAITRLSGHAAPTAEPTTAASPTLP